MEVNPEYIPNNQEKIKSLMNTKGHLEIKNSNLQQYSVFQKYDLRENKNPNPNFYNNDQIVSSLIKEPDNRTDQHISRENSISNAIQKEQELEDCKVTRSKDYETQKNNIFRISRTVEEPFAIKSNSHTIFLAYLISFTEKTSKLVIKFLLESISETDSKNILNYFFGKNPEHNFFAFYKENEISILLFGKDPVFIAKKILDDLMKNFINPLKDLKNSIAEVVLSGIRKIGFKNTKKSESADKIIYLYAINDNGNDCAKEWGTFPVLLSVSKDIIELSIIFAVNSRPGIIKGEQLRKSLEFIKRVNNTLNNFSFVYDRTKGFFLFKTSTHVLFPPCSNYHLPQILTSEATNLYTSYAYGLYCLYSEMTSNSQSESTNNKIIQIQNLKQHSAISLFITCKQRAKKPLIPFSLLTDNYINVDSQSIKLTSNLLVKEKKIIEFLKTDELLSNVFQTEKIFLNDSGVITYPKLILENNYNVRNLSMMLQENPKYYEKLINIAEKLLIGNLCFDFKKLIDNFLAVKGKIYYSFKSPLHFFFDNFRNVEINEKSIDMFKYFVQLLEGNLKQNMWNIEDLFLTGIESDGEQDLINKKYYGIKIKKETIALPSKNNHESYSEIPMNRMLKLYKNLTAVRYRMNQSYYNEYVCRYLGLIDEYTIAVIDTDQLTIEESVEIRKSSIEEENHKNLFENKEIAGKSIADYLAFEIKLKYRNLRLPSYIPTKVLVRNSQLGLKNINKTSENTLFHIIPMKELHMCHNDHSYFYTPTNEVGKSNENYSSRNSFYKNIIYYLTLYKEEGANIDQVENLDREILSFLNSCRKDFQIE